MPLGRFDNSAGQRTILIFFDEMKPFHWHKVTLAALTLLFVHGSFTSALGRKRGYLYRMQKQGPALRAKLDEDNAVPMDQAVLTLNAFSADELRQLVKATYGEASGIEVVQPSRSSKGVIVTAPKDKIKGVSALIRQADPSDLEFLKRVEPELSEGVILDGELEAFASTPKALAEMRSRAERDLDQSKTGLKQRLNRSKWFGASRSVPGRVGVRVNHADATKVAKKLQLLYDKSEVRIEPVKGADIVLMVGKPATLNKLRESVIRMDQAAGYVRASEIPDRTKYIRRLAGSRNTAFRITRPFKPRIEPLPPIQITADPQPVFETSPASKTIEHEFTIKTVDELPVAPKEEGRASDEYYKKYIEESLKKPKEVQPKILFKRGRIIDWGADSKIPRRMRSTSTYQQEGKASITTIPDS